MAGDRPKQPAYETFFALKPDFSNFTLDSLTVQGGLRRRASNRGL